LSESDWWWCWESGEREEGFVPLVHKNAAAAAFYQQKGTRMIRKRPVELIRCKFKVVRSRGTK